jgi:predicted nucleotidyltransferase
MQRGSLHSPPDVASRLEAAVAGILETASSRLVLLFGSCSEGRAHEGSDLHLPVPAETQSRIHLAVALIEAVELLLAPLPCDILVRAPGRWAPGRRTPGSVSHDADPRRSGCMRLAEAEEAPDTAAPKPR